MHWLSRCCVLNFCWPSPCFVSTLAATKLALSAVVAQPHVGPAFVKVCRRLASAADGRFNMKDISILELPLAGTPQALAPPTGSLFVPWHCLQVAAQLPPQDTVAVFVPGAEAAVLPLLIALGNTVVSALQQPEPVET